MEHLLSASSAAIQASGGVPAALLEALFAARDATEAPADVEAAEIVYRFIASRRSSTIQQLLNPSGRPANAMLVTLAEREALARSLRREADVLFATASASHACTGSNTQAGWKLRRIDSMRYREGLPDGLIAAKIAARAEEPDLEREASKGCVFDHPFAAGEHFTALASGRMYVATGDVYMCVTSGRIHVCAEGVCDRAVSMHRDEGLVCELTNRFFRAASVHSEPNHTARERQDGGVSLLVGRGGVAGGGVQSRGWHPARTKEQRDEFKERRMAHIAAHDRSETLRRALDPLTHLYYDFFDDGKTCISLLERTMRTHYPEADHPEAGPALRDAVSEVFRVLYADGVKVVRQSQWQRSAEASQRGAAVVKQYCLAELRNRRVPDYFVAQSMFAAQVQPQFERFELIGMSEEAHSGEARATDKELSMYIQDCVIAVWIMIHYMPYAKRHTKGIPLSKHIVGIIYKLQMGYYIKREEGGAGAEAAQYVVLIPRHSNLDAMPTKSDLNKHAHFKSRPGFNSAAVMETSDLLTRCFDSLLDGSRPAEEIMRFQLNKYIRIWGE